MSKLDSFVIYLRRKHRTWNLYALLLIKWGKYWDKILAYLFNYPSRCFQRESPLDIQKLKNPCSTLKYFSDYFGRFSTSKTLIGKVSSDKEDLELTQHLLQAIFNDIKSSKLSELLTAEVLAKVLAYRDLQENTRISLPTLDSSMHIQMVEYVVDTVFDLWHRHVAFGLVPTTNHTPILLFRGTHFSLRSESGRASLLADIDPDGPGRRLFYNSRSDIKHWLMQLSHQGRNPRVIGHSLGGVLAIYTSIYEHNLLAKAPYCLSYAFNPPGVSEDLLEIWNEIPLEEKPSFKTFVARGDVISKFGTLLDNSYEMFSHRPLSPIIAHEQLIFAQPVSYIAKIDLDKENSSTSRAYYSKVQKQTTSLAYRFGLKYLFPNPF